MNTQKVRDGWINFVEGNDYSDLLTLNFNRRSGIAFDVVLCVPHASMTGEQLDISDRAAGSLQTTNKP